MKNIDNAFQRLMKQDHPIIIHRESDGYSVCVPSLGILVVENTLEECYVKVEKMKTAFFESIVERGFGDSALSTRTPPSSSRPWVRMSFVLASLSLILLTILIPINYVLSSIPTAVEAAMNVVQRRVHLMSNDDQRKLSRLATSICPVVDEMVEARCSSVPAGGAPTSGGKLH